MITRFITEVTTKFNPFSASSRATRLFLASLPPDARSTGMQIHATVLPRTSTEPSSIHVKFSAFYHARPQDPPSMRSSCGGRTLANPCP